MNSRGRSRHERIMSLVTVVVPVVAGIMLGAMAGDSPAADARPEKQRTVREQLLHERAIAASLQWELHRARKVTGWIEKPTPATNRELGRLFFGRDFPCADVIATGESGWREQVWNGGRVGAYLNLGARSYGIGQAQPREKMLAFGRDAFVNPLTQMRWFRAYAVSRYGGVCSAAAHWRRGRVW